MSIFFAAACVLFLNSDKAPVRVVPPAFGRLRHIVLTFQLAPLRSSAAKRNPNLFPIQGRYIMPSEPLHIFDPRRNFQEFVVGVSVGQADECR